MCVRVCVCVMSALKALFDAHKDALGWGDKQIKFV